MPSGSEPSRQTRVMLCGSPSSNAVHDWSLVMIAMYTENSYRRFKKSLCLHFEGQGLQKGSPLRFSSRRCWRFKSLSDAASGRLVVIDISNYIENKGTITVAR